MNLPTYYDPSDVTKIYSERVGAVAQAAKEAGNCKPEPLKNLALGIDCQLCFCHPSGSLYVDGAEDDMRRAVEWVYRNHEKLSCITASIDQHGPYQIFHPLFWVDKEGNHPEPFTVITLEDYDSGKWGPSERSKKIPFKNGIGYFIRYYLEGLKKGGKYALTIWPYHALQGSVNASIVPALSEAILYHSIRTEGNPVIIQKGSDILSENYSIFEKEVYYPYDDAVDTSDYDMDGNLIPDFNLNTLAAYDNIYVFGQALSHCVLSTLLSMEKQGTKSLFEDWGLGETPLIKKIVLLTDATSSVQPPPFDPLPDDLNFPVIAEKEIERLCALGMRTSTTDKDID